MVFGILGDDGQRIFRPQLGLHLISHNGAAQSGTEDNNVSHNHSPSLEHSGRLRRNAKRRSKP